MARRKIDESKLRRFEARRGPPGADATHGVDVHYRDSDRKTAVWYAQGVDESTISPTDAARAFLDRPEPPEHLLVTSGGVSILDVE